MISDRKKQRLEDIANGINSSENSLKDRVSQIFYIPLAVYYGGVLVPEYQKNFADEIGWSPKNLTLLNATVCGLGWSAVCFLGGEGVEFLTDLNPLREAGNYLVAGLTNFFGIASKTFINVYAGYNALQNLSRIIYSQSTKKAAPSFSFSGVVFNGGHKSFRHFKGRKIY